MRTRNQNRPEYRRDHEDDYRSEPRYRQEWGPEPFDGSRSFGNRERYHEDPYYRGEGRFSSGERNWRENDHYPPYERYNNDYRTDSWRDSDERNRRNGYREENDVWYDRNPRSQVYYEPANEEDSRYYHHSDRRGSYKGRYYGKHQSAEDLREIRRRYEESRRNSNWSSGYLPQNNY